ncbi:hypothetical protein ACTFIR_002760 [Dictyostelium discoideum]
MSIDIIIEFTINDILLNKESLQKKKKYSCPICFEFIYKKSIYQCKSGHFACQKCWETLLKIKRECMICRSKVNLFQDLSRCLVIEQDFGKKECCCIYSFNNEILDDRGVVKKFKRELIKDEENGCKEILTIEDLDNHIQNCKFKFVKCPNKGCDRVFRLNSFSEHENECTFKLVTCEYCKKDDIKKDQVENHHSEVCPKVKIDCIQNCQMKIEREKMEVHMEYDCNNTIVNCKYHEQGCEFTMKRSELQNHLESVNHQIYMTKLIDKLISKVDQSNIIINDLKMELELEFNPNVYKNKWVISDFSLYGKTTGEDTMESPRFTFFSHEFQVCLNPRCRIKNNKSPPLIAILIYSSNGNRVKFECSFKLVNVFDSSKSMIVNFGEIGNLFNNKGCLYFNVIILKITPLIFLIIVYKEPMGWDYCNFLINSSSINKENGWVSDDDKLTIEIYFKILGQTYETLES